MWLYKGKEIKDITDFPDGTFGFIYLITNNKTGKKYIGKKMLVYDRKKKLGKKEIATMAGGKGRPKKFKREIKESDWKTYWGSSKPLLLELKKNQNNFTREIIDIANTKIQLTYLETKHLFINEVLENPEDWYNDSILGKFYVGKV